MTRLTADFWVRAYLRRLEGEGIPAYIAAKGDATAGAVLVVVATLDGSARAFQRSFDLSSGERVWMELVSGTEADVSASVAAQRRMDPDLWVVELEDRGGRHLLGEPGLE
ncbi:DUF1491 family protein [Palleronia sp. LCG004]|uniref:DUF1491 family protein n=1 Tax=Palleronia sp. LCG004 TaxID=3079304 RepID=UPI002943D0F8|nr:DUF1491 family protein [Palleronia sp. LCG004]WOI56651.1 DUF1491 family protein [Palleronia sp. LCG004]